MSEDPDKKILEWCGHLAVPRLVDEKAYAACKGCQTKIGGFLTKNTTHHCRLCGELFCGACTAKYHVPLIFRIKNKDGPTRVCMSCVDGCMSEKAKAQAPKTGAPVGYGSSSLATSTVSASLASMARQVEIAPPEKWQDEADFVQCPKCSAKKVKTHNCRVCGLCFCDKCTSKMELPPYFEKKKGKTGPSRCCDSCRFKIVSGAKLVEHLSAQAMIAQGVPKKAQPPPPPKGFLGVGRRTSVSQGKSAEPKPDEDQSLQVVVKREGSDAVIAQLTIPSGDTNLTTIDVLLKKTCPQTEAYQYVFRGEPVPEVFGAVILARHLGNILLIRPKRKGGVGAMAVDEPSLTDSNVLLGGVSQVNNPFRTDPAVEAARRAAKEAKEAKSKIKPRVFAKPKLTPRILASSKPPPASGAKKVPPPMPGVAGGLKANPNSASAALASGESVEAICKARAKAIFGQLP